MRHREVGGNIQKDVTDGQTAKLKMVWYQDQKIESSWGEGLGNRSRYVFCPSREGL